MNRSKFYMIIAVILILSIVGCGSCYYLGMTYNKGETVTEFHLTDEVKKGGSVSGKYIKVSVPKSSSTDSSKTITSEEQLDDMVAATTMYRGQALTVTSVCKKADVDRNLDFSIPATVDNTLANTLNPQDLVAIKVKFEDGRKDAVVIPDVTVDEIRTQNGESIKEEGAIPGFLLFKVTNDEASLLNDATKEGSLYLVRYVDLSEPLLKQDYVYNVNNGKPNNASPNNIAAPAATN